MKAASGSSGVRPAVEKLRELLPAERTGAVWSAALIAP